MSKLNETENYCVYVHTSPSNKAYIGITSKDPKERWGNNGSHYKKNKHFWNAIQKYEWDNFKHEILFEKLTKDEACRIEILLIALFDTQNSEFGYNISPGGELGMTGCHLSNETKQKLSEVHKGLLEGEKNPMHGVSPKDRMDEETYENWKIKIQDRMSIKENTPFYGHIHTDESKQKMRESHEWQKGENHPMYRKRHTEEAKAKISRANTGRKYSDEINSKKGKKGANNPSAKAVEQYSKDGVFIKRWDYATLASETLRIDLSSIIACCRGTNGRKTAGGFMWKYVDEEEFSYVKSACI